MKEDVCGECGQDATDCICPDAPVPVIAGQESLFEVPETDEDEETHGAYSGPV